MNYLPIHIAVSRIIHRKIFSITTKLENNYSYGYADGDDMNYIIVPLF